MPFISVIGASGGGGPTLWTPANLAVAPHMWFDASEIAGSDGDKIDQLTDISGNGRDFVVTVNNNNRAALRTGVNGQNGLNVYDFDADIAPSGAKGYKRESSPMSGLTAGSFFAVLEGRDSPDGTSGGTMVSQFGGGGADIMPWTISPTRYLIGFGGSSGWWSDFTSSAKTLDPWHIIGMTIENNNADFYIDDDLMASQGSVTVGWGSTVWIGNNSVTGAFYDNKMGEIVILGYLATTDERNRITGYLAHKWGTTGRLDAGHPYKTDPPFN